jgi:hypothetical protein
MTLSDHCEPYISESTLGFSGNTFDVLINTLPPEPSPATALSFTGIKATPCSNTHRRFPLSSTNLIMLP